MGTNKSLIGLPMLLGTIQLDSLIDKKDYLADYMLLPIKIFNIGLCGILPRCPKEEELLVMRIALA